MNESLVDLAKNKKLKVSFIGFGSMAQAIAQGLTKKEEYKLFAAAPTLKPGLNKDDIYMHYNNKVIAQEADILILAVKPTQMLTVIQEIKAVIPPACLIISVAAGLNLAWFSQNGLASHALIRAMPNMPVCINQGAIALFANSQVNKEQKKRGAAFFTQLGLITWVDDEKVMDVYTALSGSGPAYVFLFIEALVDAAVHLGLNRQVAENFAIQTVLGATELTQQSDLNLSQLKTRVTSPSGTTAAALKVLEGPINDLLLKALQEAIQRARELSIV